MSRPVRDLLAAATRRLAAAGIDSARADAEWLLAAALAVPRSRLLLVADADGDAVERYEAMVTRRAAREPLQHLVGTVGFRRIELAVGPGVFVPRPETELLVDAVLPLRPGSLVVDLCAGSGALALALVTEAAGITAVAVERSPAALIWLRRNVAALDLATHVRVEAGDIRDPRLLAPLAGVVDAVVSNPPYVPTTTAVGPEVEHDPAQAVFAGRDGLALMPAIIAAAGRLLRPGGVLAVEHDDTHADSVPGLVISDGRFARVVDHRDLAGRPRFVTAVRAGDA